MANIKRSFKAPIRAQMLKPNGELTYEWERFFLDLEEIVRPLGQEQSFELANNQSSAADIVGMKFGAAGVAHVIVEYLVQRISGSVELTESGIFVVNYNPTSASWNVNEISNNDPDDAGIAFSMSSTDLGQVQYTTDNQAGTFTLSRIYWRSRSLAGKSNLYSKVGSI